VPSSSLPPANGAATGDAAVCEAAAIFQDIQAGPAQEFGAIVGADTDVFPDPETLPPLQEIGEQSLLAADLITDIVYPKNPLLVQHLRDAFVGYGEGAANLVTALALPQEQNQAAWLAGLQQILDGRDALSAANDEIELMEIAGEIDCP
jgi:hypothetical protein